MEILNGSNEVKETNTQILHQYYFPGTTNHQILLEYLLYIGLNSAFTSQSYVCICIYVYYVNKQVRTSPIPILCVTQLYTLKQLRFANAPNIFYPNLTIFYGKCYIFNSHFENFSEILQRRFWHQLQVITLYIYIDTSISGGDFFFKKNLQKRNIQLK